MRSKRNFLSGTGFVLAVLGLTAPGDARAQTTGPGAAGVDSAAVLTLDRVTSLALLNNPDLQTLSWDLRAQEARLIQAGLRPNPEVSLSLENAGGQRPAFSEAEMTVSLGQLIELGGKRGARVGAAETERSVLALEYEALKLAVMAEVARRFVEGLAADRLVALLSETERIAGEIRSSVALKVRAGASSPAEAARADLDVQNARLRRQDAEQERLLARARLSSLWGVPEPRFAGLAGNLDSLAALPGLETLRGRIDESPDFARLLAGVEARRQELALARANRTPDLEIEAGVRRLGESDETTFTGAVSFPLPLFDRNQGNIGAARAGISGAEADVARARVNRTRDLTEKHASIARSRARAVALREEILPTARRVFDEIRAGYERGRFGYVDLLEARRALADARREELETLLQYHRAVADAELLLGGRLDRTGEENPDR